MTLETLRLLILGLAVFAIVMLAGLILARVVRDQILAHRERQRRAIVKALIATTLEADSRALAPYASRDLLVAEAALGLADNVRGPELDRLKAALMSYGLAPRLIRRLDRGAKRQRMMAAEALALTPGDQTVAALNGARADRSVEVRLAAMFSLLDLEESPSITEILETVGSGEWSRSLMVTELLRRLGRERQAELAEEIERHDQEPPVQVMLLEAVGGAGEFEVLPTVAAQVDDEDPAVRAAAVRAMGRLGHPTVQPEISRALEDADPEVRRDAVIAAHKAALQDLAPQLGWRLGDRVWEVRHAAAQALADLGAPGRKVLEHALARADAERRREIELAMEEPAAW